MPLEEPPNPDSRPSLMPHIYYPRPRLGPVGRAMFGLYWPVMRVLGGFNGIDRVYGSGVAKPTEDEIEQGCIEGAGFDYAVSDKDLDKIPREGPVLMIANHPMGMPEGLVTARLFREIRPDCKQLVNEFLKVFPILAKRYICVKAFDPEASTADNMAPLREALRWLQDGHLLSTFPAGEVSHITWKHWSVTDSQWNPSITMLARKSGATVVPVYWHGHNGMMFQLSGLLSPKLRTAQLARNLANKKGQTIRGSIGTPISPEKIASFSDRDTLMEYLRGRVYMLQGRSGRASLPQPRKPRPSVLPPVTTSDRCADEIMRLEPESHIFESGAMSGWIARAHQIPEIMREIGRLREVTFREVGEGTGNQLDLDDFDRSYRHLFIWNEEKQEVVGSYRLGLTDEIIAEQGIEGLYTRTLFDYDKPLLDELGPCIELGRSFVRPEYQRTFKPLMLLWRGIARFAAMQKKYRYAFGVVSISDDYDSMSKRLMTEFLEAHLRLPFFEPLISARSPYQRVPVRHWDHDTFKHVCESLEDIDALVKDIENSKYGVPVLLRQYMKLDAKLMAAFNVDRGFSNVIDGLMLVDFVNVDRRIMQFYIGDDMSREFLTWHGIDPAQDPESLPRDLVEPRWLAHST